MKIAPISEIKLTDVIHFYQGCKFIIIDKEGYFEDEVHIVAHMNDGSIEIWGKDCEAVPLDKVRLLLRRMEDMTEDEENYYYEICKEVLHLKNPNDTEPNILSTVDTPISFAWTIKMGFDIFGLIKGGYAIDIKKRKK